MKQEAADTSALAAFVIDGKESGDAEAPSPHRSRPHLIGKIACKANEPRDGRHSAGDRVVCRESPHSVDRTDEDGAFLERGNAAAAAKLLSQSLDIVRASGMRRYEALVAGNLAIAALDMGETASARAWLEVARRAAIDCATEPSLQTTVTIHEVSVAMSNAPEAERPALGRKLRAATRHRTQPNWRHRQARLPWRLLKMARADVAGRHRGSWLAW